MRKFFGTILFLLGMTSFFFVAPADVHADETARQVEALSAQGAERFGDGDFHSAIEYFEEAYELEPVPNLLYNIGRCYEQLEEWEVAQEYFEKFITSPDVDTNAREHAMERVQSLREIMAAEEDEDEVPEEAVAELEELDEQEGPNMLPGYALVGGGATLLIGGAVMGLMANGNATRMSDDTLAYDDRLAAQSTARTQGIVADVFYVSGAAAAAAGVYLLVTAGSNSDTNPMAQGFFPWFGQSSAGVGLQLGF